VTRLAAATLVTGDEPLLDDLLRLTAAVGVVLDLAQGPAVTRPQVPHW